jgi:hypothetical protein
MPPDPTRRQWSPTRRYCDAIGRHFYSFINFLFRYDQVASGGNQTVEGGESTRRPPHILTAFFDQLIQTEAEWYEYVMDSTSNLNVQILEECCFYLWFLALYVGGRSHQTLLFTLHEYYNSFCASKSLHQTVYKEFTSKFKKTTEELGKQTSKDFNPFKKGPAGLVLLGFSIRHERIVDLEKFFYGLNWVISIDPSIFVTIEEFSKKYLLTLSVTERGWIKCHSSMPEEFVPSYLGKQQKKMGIEIHLEAGNHSLLISKISNQVFVKR